MLETEIKKLTKAVEALTEAMTAAPAGAAKAAEQPAPKPAEQPAPAPKPATPAVPPSPGPATVANVDVTAPDLETVKAKAREVAQKLGDGAPIQKLLSEYGATKLSELPTDQLMPFMAGLSALVGGEQ